MSGRIAVRTLAGTLALAIAAGACSDVPDDILDTDRPLTAEFVSKCSGWVTWTRPIGLSSGHHRAWGSTTAATCSS